MIGKMKVFIGFGVVIFIWLIYFATQLSTTYDPIKSYQYSMSMEEVQERLFKAVSSNSNMTLHLKDTTGTDKEYLHYYADILVEGGSENYMFTISFYKKDSPWDDSLKSEVSLIGAFDRVRSTGGYKMEDADVEKLIAVFENRVINKID
jgi:hypothetical protein